MISIQQWQSERAGLNAAEIYRDKADPQFVEVGTGDLLADDPESAKFGGGDA